MTTQTKDASDGEVVFLSPILPRNFRENGVSYIGVRSIVATVPTIGTCDHHPGIVPAEIEGE